MSIKRDKGYFSFLNVHSDLQPIGMKNPCPTHIRKSNKFCNKECLSDGITEFGKFFEVEEENFDELQHPGGKI